ncbi:MAG: hypothetical protein FJ288_02305 [Planctomycetes bacterium]|nr:hypothetical protein [Planctomycetota bacterium]
MKKATKKTMGGSRKTKKVRGAGATPKAAAKAGRMSGLDAAAKVLAEASQPMNAKAMVEAMLAKGYWASGGKTPWATIFAAVIREIAAKGEKARFRKTARGMFELAK